VTKVKLTTDYIDYYDIWLESRHCTNYDFEFKRIAGNSPETSYPHKSDQFRILRDVLGETVVPHGTMATLYAKYPMRSQVVYTEEWRHAAQGKELYTPQQVRDIVSPTRPGGQWDGSSHPRNQLASMFINTGPVATSYKYVQIGKHAFMLKIINPENWMTNASGAEVEIIDNYVSRVPHYSYLPVFAIDYIEDSATGVKLACDLNHAPGLRNLGIKDILPPRRAAEAIVEWYENFNDVR
jgi:hypothetical protein